MGTLVDDEDLLHIVLKGLRSEYESFSTAMLTKSEPVSFEELHVLMITQEELLKNSQKNSKENSIMAMAANKGSSSLLNLTTQLTGVIFRIVAVAVGTAEDEAITEEASPHGVAIIQVLIRFPMDFPNLFLNPTPISLHPTRISPNPNLTQISQTLTPIAQPAKFAINKAIDRKSVV